MIPFVIVIIWLGVYPAPVLRRMEPSAQKLVTTVEQGAQLATQRALPVVAQQGAVR
jgi:NADH:ubiquinone oxidoreductase subunit 4 (chain M)